MNKSLIALAIAALSSNAFAVNFTDTPPKVAKYASEITMPADLTDTATDDLDATFALGFSATLNVKRYVRIDLTNAKFQKNVAASNLTTTYPVDPANPAITVNLDPSISVKGAAGDTYVVIEITPSATLPNTAKLKLNLANITATGGDIGIKYRLYEFGYDAYNENKNILAEKSGTLVSFESGLTAKVTTTGAKRKIDVTQFSKFFEDETAAKAQKLKDNAIGTVSITATDKVYAKDGSPVTLATLMDNTSKLEVAGDFSAGAKDANGKLDASAAKFSGVTAAPTITASKASFVLDPTTSENGGTLTYTVDGATAIATGTYKATLVPTAKTGYTLSTIDLGTLGTLEKNGDTEEANLVLAPDTAYKNLVRISNTSGIAGKFYITAIADDGKSVTFPLSDVTGQPASLDAGASTKQMMVKDIFAAAKAKGLALTGDMKLRLKVEGEVGSLSLQTYTVSKDGNALNSLNTF